MFLSRAMTAPTCFRSQVARVATSRAICMKYWSQLARSRALMLDGSRYHLTTCGGHGLVPRVKRKSRWPGLAGWVLAIAVGFPALRLALGEPRSDKEVAEQILANMAVGSPAASSSAAAAS